MTRIFPPVLRAALAAMLLGLVAMPGHATELKIATLAPDGTSWMQAMRKGADEIARRTDQRVLFKFYPGGVMGNAKSVLRKIRAGQLHGGALTGGGLNDIYPDNQIYSLPFTYNSLAEVDAVRARLDATLARGLEQRGFVSFGLAEGGFAYLMSTDPIRSVAELRSRKIWVPEGDDVSRSTFEDMGISPVPLPLADVLTGLQTGLINSIGASTTGAIALQWHTKVRYVTDVPLMYLFGLMVIDAKAFARLTPADQKVVREVMGRVFTDLNRQNRADNDAARVALAKEGIEFVRFAPAELDQLRASAAATVQRLADQGVYSPALLKQTRDILDAYRRSGGKR